MAWHSVPADGVVCAAAVRYLARKHSLYGKDNAEATKIDIIFDSLVDFGGNGELTRGFQLTQCDCIMFQVKL